LRHVTRHCIPGKVGTGAPFALMSWIAFDFARIEKAACLVPHGPARLSDAREKSDKKMLGFPTAATRPASYDESKFSGNAASP